MNSNKQTHNAIPRTIPTVLHNAQTEPSERSNNQKITKATIKQYYIQTNVLT
jgi:hypothetical protein